MLSGIKCTCWQNFMLNCNSIARCSSIIREIKMGRQKQWHFVKNHLLLKKLQRFRFRKNCFYFANVFVCLPLTRTIQPAKGKSCGHEWNYWVLWIALTTTMPRSPEKFSNQKKRGQSSPVYAHHKMQHPAIDNRWMPFKHPHWDTGVWNF